MREVTVGARCGNNARLTLRAAVNAAVELDRCLRRRFAPQRVRLRVALTAGLPDIGPTYLGGRRVGRKDVVRAVAELAGWHLPGSLLSRTLMDAVRPPPELSRDFRGGGPVAAAAVHRIPRGLVGLEIQTDADVALVALDLAAVDGLRELANVDHYLGVSRHTGVLAVAVQTVRRSVACRWGDARFRHTRRRSGAPQPQPKQRQYPPQCQYTFHGCRLVLAFYWRCGGEVCSSAGNPNPASIRPGRAADRAASRALLTPPGRKARAWPSGGYGASLQSSD